MEIDANNGINELKSLGFTHLESEIYIHLLGAKASSGYAIAQAIAKPAANVYKAITILEKKGAILIEEGNTRLCIPVPVNELLNALQRSFIEQKDRASQFLNQIEHSESNDTVYRLKTPGQVFEKCRYLLENAQEIILVDAFSLALDPLMDELESARQRGVKIAIHGYENIELQGARVFQNPQGQAIHEKWSGQWLNIVADSKSFVMAYLSQDLAHVHQAVWSESQYISWVYHSALLAEQQLSELKTMLRENDDIQTLRSRVADMELFFDLNAPGYLELLEKYQFNKE